MTVMDATLRPRRGALAGCLRGLVALALGMAVTVAGAVLAPVAFDLRPYTVLSGSMAPAIATGDVVVTETIAPRQARVGDVVTFRDPARPNRVISHRLRSVRVFAGVAQMVTRGDANEASERWSVPADGRIGRVRFKVRRVGALAVVAGTPAGRLLLIVGPAALLGMAEIRRLRRARR